jgi:hypothetical protein
MRRKPRLAGARNTVRIGEAVGMVDAQAVRLALRDELHHAPMRRREDVLALGAQAGEIVDVEEAAVVDVVGGHAPEREAVGLPASSSSSASKLRASPGCR